MRNQVARACYWLGIACTGVAVVWRLLVAVGFNERIIYGDRAVGMEGFFKAAVLFLLVAIATAVYDALSERSD